MNTIDTDSKVDLLFQLNWKSDPVDVRVLGPAGVFIQLAPKDPVQCFLVWRRRHCLFSRNSTLSTYPWISHFRSKHEAAM